MQTYQPSTVSENWNVDVHLRSTSSLFCVSFSVKGHLNFSIARDMPFCVDFGSFIEMVCMLSLHVNMAVASTDD